MVSKLTDIFRRLASKESGSGSMVTFTPWDEHSSAAKDSGPVTADIARGLPGVGRGVSFHCEVMSQLTPAAYTGTFKPSHTEQIMPPPMVLRDPDPHWHPLPTWLYSVTEQLQWHGNAFAYRGADVCDYTGYPTRLPLMAAHCMNWLPADGVYEHSAEGGGLNRLPSADVLHWALNVRPEKRMGQGILSKYQHELKIIRATEQAQMVVMNAGVPTGILSINTPNVTQDQATTAKKTFLESQRVRGVAVLAMAEFKAVQWNADEMSMIPTREYNLRLASDITGTPPYLLGVPSESRVYTNMETEWTNFLRGKFGELLNVLEWGLSTTQPRTTEVRFNIDELTRSDSATRWTIYQKALSMIDPVTGIPVMNVQEIRNAESLGSISLEGDKS